MCIIITFHSENEGFQVPLLTLGDNGSKKSIAFSPTHEQCKNTASFLSDRYPGTLEFNEAFVQHQLDKFNGKDSLKHIILLPPVNECCEQPLIIRSRPSYPLVYTTKGTFVAACFGGECRNLSCNRKFHHSYVQESSGKTIHYYSTKNAKYLQCTSQTVFEIALLQDMTNNISISAASFESRAEVYNENFRDIDCSRLKEFHQFGRNIKDQVHPWKLTDKCAEDAWFLYRLVTYHSDNGDLISTNFATDVGPSQRKDVDELCRQAWEKISSHTNPWVHHQCKKKGCEEGKQSYLRNTST